MSTVFDKIADPVKSDHLFFLGKEFDEHFNRERHIAENHVKLIEGNGRFHWKTLKRNLAQDYNVSIKDGVEPHWINSGEITLWEYDQFLKKWDNTAPFTPDHNKLFNMLKKGLQVRPPSQGVDGINWLVESATVVEKEVPDNRPKYTLETDKGPVVSRTWRHHVEVRNKFKQAITIDEIPKDVMERYQASAYVCIHHDKTYKNEKAATQFVKQCDYCKSIEDMQQHIKPKKEKANAKG